MRLADPEIESLVARASTLNERLAGEYVPTGGDEDVLAADERLRRWRETMAEGDARRWSQRLEWDGLDPRRLRAALGAVERAPGTPLPGWAALVREASAEAEALAAELASRAPADRVLDADAPRAFQELLLPFVRVGRRRLGAEDAAWAPLMTEGAAIALERALLETLEKRAQRALFHEFAVFRRARGRTQQSALSALLGGSGRVLYDAFVRERLAGYGGTLSEYPVLARLLATQVLFWVENVGRMLERLAADLPAIRREMAPAAPADDRVAQVISSLSDPHRGGKTVAVLRFESGLYLVYKPRGLGIELRFSELLAWLNERGLEPGLRALAVLDRGEYGWVEHATVAPCSAPEEVERFFTRAGMLLCLSYVLGGADLHSGNVHACGEHPVLIDLEVLFLSLVRGTGQTPAEERRRHNLNSVMHTSLLPAISTYGGEVVVDGGLLERPAGVVHRHMGIRHVNTDAMSWAQVETTMEAGPNVPLVDGVPASTLEHVDAVRTGFRRMAELLRAHRGDLTAPGGPIQRFAGTRGRFVFRGTGHYQSLRLRALHPSYLRSGADRSIVLDHPKKVLLGNLRRPPLWEVWSAEQAELEQDDIPAFYSSPEGVGITSGCGVHIPDVFCEPGLATVLQRLDRLDEEVCQTQMRIIDVMLTSARHHVGRRGQPFSPPLAEGTSREERAITDAVAIGELLADSRVRSGDGTADWFGLVDDPDPSRTHLGMLDAAVFNGTGGIALFFAALARCTGEGRYAEIAGEATLRARRAVADPEAREALADRIGIGGACGLGALVYAFTRLATLLDDASYLESAREAAAGITIQRINADDRLDVMAGSAGALLGLLALYEATGEGDVLRLATRCGVHLSRRREGGRSPVGQWTGADGRLGTGFAHGTAGIVAALVRLYRHLGEPALLFPVMAALEAERRSFLPEEQNWLDLPPTASAADTLAAPGSWCSWCRGAAGIGLARLTAVDLLGERMVGRDLEAAIATSTAQEWPSSDHLCCGTLGRVDFLVTAAERLGRPELRSAVHEKLDRLRDGWNERGGYGTGYRMELSPGLFQGTSGIGYGLLRAARPDLVPSVLTWE